MILVTVSDDDRPKVLALRSQPAEVWVHELGTILIGEADVAPRETTQIIAKKRRIEPVRSRA